MKIDCSWWRCVRRWWHMRLRGLTPAAAEDLMDGLDLGDREIHMPPPRLWPAERRRWPAPHPPACPGLPTPEDLERLDREFLAGGPVTDAVIRGVLRDLRSPPLN